MNLISDEASRKPNKDSQLAAERVALGSWDIFKLDEMSVGSSELSQPQRVTNPCSYSISARLKYLAAITSLCVFLTNLPIKLWRHSTTPT